MKIEAYFLKPTARPSAKTFPETVLGKIKNPYFSKDWNWEKRSVQIRNTSGELIFSADNVEVPSFWSQNATTIFASQYLRIKNQKTHQLESSLKQVLDRVVDTIKDFGKKNKYFDRKIDAEIFSAELKYILLQQKAFFNSPVWYNCGLFHKYGIAGDTPLWFWDKKENKTKLSDNSYQHPQVSACFIQSVEDSLESIYQLLGNEAKIFKFGSGSGTNFSRLRSRFDRLKSGGRSSGLISFLRVFDQSASAVKSGGTTRRAAKMVCVDADHPEVLDLIRWKSEQEELGFQLRDLEFFKNKTGSLESFLEGQNANNSIRISAVMMQKLSKSLVNGTEAEIWRKLCQAAWKCADPGVQFSTTINAWNTCAADAEIRASNPCSEFFFLDDTACNLASLNLLAFWRNDVFQVQDFLHTAKIIFLAQEILVDLAGYPTEKIAANSNQYRPLGLGFCGLGALLMRMQLAYSSDEGRKTAQGLSFLLFYGGLQTSHEIAKSHGPYAAFKKNKKSHLGVIQKHNLLAHDLFKNKILSRFGADADSIPSDWNRLISSISKYGLRNSQITAMAPTGTIGLVMDSETTGVEPEFSLLRTKNLSGGGQMTFVSESLIQLLKKWNLSQEAIKNLIENLRWTGKIEFGQADLKRISNTSPHKNLWKNRLKILQTAHDLSPMDHLKMVAEIQKFVSGGISKTINLPADATAEDISTIYFQAWKMGLKSVSIYRDASKLSQPLRSPANAVASPLSSPHRCPECGSWCELQANCWRCINCGHVSSCA